MNRMKVIYITLLVLCLPAFVSAGMGVSCYSIQATQESPADNEDQSASEKGNNTQLMVYEAVVPGAVTILPQFDLDIIHPVPQTVVQDITFTVFSPEIPFLLFEVLFERISPPNAP